MVKKASAKRGYMTLGEINSKLDKKYKESAIKDEVWEDMNPRRLDKIDYLQKVLKKKNLLDAGTRERVYDILDNLYAQEVRSQKWQYVKSGFSRSETYKLDNASEDIDARGKLAEERGDYPLAVKFYEQALALNEKAERLEAGSHSGVHSREQIDALKKKIPRNISFLERLMPLVIAVVGLVSGIFFFSTSVTGNAISNLSSTTSSWIGGVLVLIGVVALGFWIKNKKRSKKK